VLYVSLQGRYGVGSDPRQWALETRQRHVARAPADPAAAASRAMRSGGRSPRPPAGPPTAGAPWLATTRHVRLW